MSIVGAIRDRFVKATSRGDVDRDPEEVVEAGRVGFSQGPIVASRLDEIGIKAAVVEDGSGRAVTGRSRIMVLRRDVDRAAAFIEQFSRDFPSRDMSL